MSFSPSSDFSPLKESLLKIASKTEIAEKRLHFCVCLALYHGSMLLIGPHYTATSAEPFWAEWYVCGGEGRGGGCTIYVCVYVRAICACVLLCIMRYGALVHFNHCRALSVRMVTHVRFFPLLSRHMFVVCLSI